MAAFEIGKVYHQTFSNGDRVYFKPISLQKNGRYSGVQTESFNGSKGRTPKKCSADSNYFAWIETPQNEIPPKMAES